MIFHSRLRNMSVFDDMKLELDGIPIKRVKSFNFLGIILNEYLTWTDHISHISQKISNPMHRQQNIQLNDQSM